MDDIQSSDPKDQVTEDNFDPNGENFIKDKESDDQSLMAPQDDTSNRGEEYSDAKNQIIQTQNSV